MNNDELALFMHGEWKGKLEILPKIPLNDKEDLAICYTPGVAAPCIAIKNNPELSFDLTGRQNLCAVITDGSAVLGLGDIGPLAGMPVMEGKCALFKKFAGVDAFPICINSRDVDEIVNTIHLISGSFGGINLEDISAPRCFEIEDRLKRLCNIPVFHDDQHGTAIVTLAGLYNALKLVGKELSRVRIVISGAGAAAIAITRLLLKAGAKDIIMCDTRGAIYQGRDGLNDVKTDISRFTNYRLEKGSLEDVIRGADVFIGVSAPGVLTSEMVRSMGHNAIVFACANPVPEIEPIDAKNAGAKVVATGRSDHPNQINNLLAFPGIFRGAFDVHAKDITDNMKLAAAKAIAGLVDDDELNEYYIIPSPFDERVARCVAEEVARAARS